MFQNKFKIMSTSGLIPACLYLLPHGCSALKVLHEIPRRVQIIRSPSPGIPAFLSYMLWTSLCLHLKFPVLSSKGQCAH